MDKKQFAEQAAIVGHIEGLLEAWFDRGNDTNWQDNVCRSRDAGKLLRIRELRDCLGAAFIVHAMDDGLESTKILLRWLAEL